LVVAIAERAKDAHYRYFARTVGALPWPNIEGVEADLARLSRSAHAGADVDDELDRLVARAYGVSESELRILRTYLTERLR